MLREAANESVRDAFVGTFQELSQSSDTRKKERKKGSEQTVCRHVLCLLKGNGLFSKDSCLVVCGWIASSF